MSNKTTPSRNVSGLRITRRKLYVAMLAASQFMGVGKVMAAPEGGVVVGGAGTIDQSGVNTTIHQSTERMAIDWQSFDVKSNERVQFIQPKATSIALNRVVSNKGSEILGRIDANGQVFLINPNGVVFGKDSQINVGGMIASGLSIDPQDFMNGEFTLTSLEGTDGKVINSGIINASTGGSVTLIGKQVKNEGLISAKLGAVNLAAGKEAVVTFDKTGLVGVKVTKEVLQKDLGVDAAVLNSGEINAEGGRILITASVSQDIFSEAVNNGGMNKASSVVVHEDGSFTLGAGSDVVNTGSINTSAEVGNAGQVVVLGNNITNSGNIHADATTGTAGNIELHSTDITSLEKNAKVTAKASVKGVGGDVKILGNKVGLFDTADVNASGANGGGQVLIGGDQTGANIKIRNADFIYVGENTNVKTDGLLNGDGGKLITFASDTARIYGSLSARGGSQGGNGGFVETSGLKGFEIAKAPDISASAGHAGTWLIDPDDIVIGGDSGNMPNQSEASQGNGLFIFSPKNAGDAQLRISVLEPALSAGGTVIVKTTSSGTGAGNITFNADMVYDVSGKNTNNPNPATLIFDADNNIIINNKITREFDNQNKLNVELKAKGDVKFSAGATIETQGGSFKASGINFTTADSTTPAISTNGGNVELNFTGAISIASGIKTNGGDFDTNISKTGSTFNNSLPNGSIDAGAGIVTIRETDSVNLGNITSTGLIITRLTGGAAFALNQSATTKLIVAGDTDIDIGNGSVSLISSTNDFGSVHVSGAGDVNIHDTNAINFKGIANTITGDFNLTAGGNVTQVGAPADMRVTGKTTLSATGNVIFTNAGNDFTGEISTGTSVGSLSVVNKKNFSVGNIKSSGDVTFKIDPASVQSSTKQISLNGNLTSSVGTVTFENQVKNTAATNTIDAKVITFNDNFLASGSVTFKNADDIKIKGDFTSSAGASLDIANTKNFSAHDIAKTKLTIKATGVVSINSIENSGITGDVSSNIQGTDGFGVDISGDQISIGAIDVTGGGGTPVPNSGFTQAPHDAGVVAIAGVTAVNLNGNITSEGGTGNQFAGVDTTTGQPISVATSGLSTVAQISVGKVGTAGTVNLNYGQAFTSIINLTGNSANDTLNGSNTAREWDITKENGGSIKDVNVGFSDFGNILGGNQSDTFNISANVSSSIKGGGGNGTGANIFNINVASIDGTINGDSGDDTFNINAAMTKVVINGGVGNDTFNIKAPMVGGILNGDAGADTFNVLISGPINTTLNGGADTDTLVGFDAVGVTNNWGLGGNTETLNTTLGFSAIENITGGNNSVDIFSFSGARSVTGTIKAGTGAVDDVVNVSGDAVIDFTAVKFTINGVENAETIKNNAATAALTAKSATSTNVSWVIDKLNPGSVAQGTNTVNFLNFTDLKGGAGNDVFVIKNNGAITGVIDGLTGSNSVDISSVTNTNAYSVAINSIDPTKTLRVKSMDTITGNDNANTLSIESATNTSEWSITGDNSGAIKNTDIGTITNTVTFSKFQNLVGGKSVDNFTFSGVGNISGEINGGVGGGTNTLIGLDVDTDWSITGTNSGNVSLAGLPDSKYVNSFVAIQNLQGNGHVDTFKYIGEGSVDSANGGTEVGDNFVNLKESTKAFTLTLGAGGSDTFGATNISSFTGNNSDTLILKAGNGENTWIIKDKNIGTVGGIQFSNFKKLEGGTGTDTFQFNNFVSLSSTFAINGDDGHNVVNLSNITDFSEAKKFTYVLSAGADGTFAAKNIAEVVGKDSDFLTLRAGDTNNTWTINQLNEGSVEIPTKITFSGFKNLTGGSGTDDFTFTGTGAKNPINIDGGDNSLGNKNSLTVIDQATTWDLPASGNNTLKATEGDIYVSSFSEIQTLQGGKAVDIFNINQAFAGDIKGGASDDIFYINAHVNELHGDDGDDTFDFSKGLLGTATLLDGGNSIKNNILIARSVDANQSSVNNVWYVPAAGSNENNTLSVSDDNGVAITRYVDSFSNIKELRGGDGLDFFDINTSGYTTNGGLGNTVRFVSTAETILTGGEGDDTYVFRAGGSADAIHDANGNRNIIIALNGNNLWTLNSNDASAKNTLAEVDANGNVTNLYLKDFSNIQAIIGGSSSDKFIINTAWTGEIKGGAGNDTFVLTANGSATKIDGGASAPGVVEINTLVGRNAPNTWVAMGAGTGNDTGKNKGQVFVSGSANLYATFSAIQVLQGGSSSDTLVNAVAAKSNWNIDNSTAKSLSTLVDANANSWQFSGMESLKGNDNAVDVFMFAKGSTAIAGLIDGGTSANDELDLTALTTATVDLGASHADAGIFRVKNIESINAPTAVPSKNQLIGASDLAYTWTIDSNNHGSVSPTSGNPVSAATATTFSGFGLVTGGSNHDIFNITAVEVLTTSIDGGDGMGIDSLDYSKHAANVDIQLNAVMLANADGSFDAKRIVGVEHILGSDSTTGAFSRVISVDAGDHVWGLGSVANNAGVMTDGVNDGQVKVGAINVAFENFNALNGSSGNDQFNLVGAGKFIGSLNGGNGGSNSVSVAGAIDEQTLAIGGTGANTTNLFNINQVSGNGKSTLMSEIQENDWNIDVKGAGTLNKVNKIAFDGFSRLVGGVQRDTFTITSIDGLNIILDGGSVSSGNDTVDLTGLQGAVTIGAGADTKADIKIINIDSLNANASNINTLVAEEASPVIGVAKSNEWSITGNNKGTLNTDLAFDGFANLVGGQGADTFTLAAGASVTGIIDGGLGEDKVDAAAADHELYIQQVNADKILPVNNISPLNLINLINVEHLEASASHVNTLAASDVANQWSISDKNAGSVTNITAKTTTTFKNVANLVGGGAGDTFVFDVLGSLDGYIDGGVGDASLNSVDLHARQTGADIVLSTKGTGYRNVGKYIGNNSNSTLTGDENNNTWTLGIKDNSGTINKTDAADNKIVFSGFVNLVGGEGNDSFDLSQGKLQGTIRGGAGDDTFTLSEGLVAGIIDGEVGNDKLFLTLSAASSQNIHFDGGDGVNRIKVGGGSMHFATAAHTSTGNASGQLNYTSQDNKEFTLIYSGIGDITDELIATSLTLNSTANPDVFTFTNKLNPDGVASNTYSLSGFSTINYSNKDNLIIAGAADDKVSIEGEVNGLQSLTINNAALSSTVAGLIRVKDLYLNNIGSAGDATNRLNLSVDNISVSAANGDIYLKDDSGLAINEFANNKLFNLLLTGDLTSNKLLTSFGDFVADVSGRINLIQDNALSGNLTLSAGSDINFHNVGATNLNDVKAQNIDINSTGAINGNGAFTVSGRAVFASDDSLVLMSAANNFNELVINSAVDASVTDKDLLTLFGVKTSGAVDMHSSGVSVKGVVDVADLTLDAGQKAALIDANISASQSINVNGLGLTTTGKLTASEITLNGLAGDVSLSGVLDTSGKQTITVVGNNIIQNAKITGGGNVDLHANGSLTQNADIESAENILVAADGDLTMNANTTSKGNDVNYTAGGVMNLLGNIVANNSIAIDGKKAVNQFGSFVSAIGNVVVKAGKFIMSGEATATANKGSVLVTSEDDIAISGNINANSGVDITSTNGNFQQHAQINNQQNDIMVLAKNNIIMDGNAVSTAASGNINYAGNNIFLNLLNAKNGTVLLTANPGEVIDNNGSAMNIVAKGLDVDAGVGIGANDSIETSISELSASNSLGNIGITNNQAVNITQLRTNGNVTFENLTGNVVLGNQPPVSGGETPNRPTTETSYQTNNLIIKVSSGNLLASGSKSVDHPEITATNTALIVSGTIGLVNRPLVIDGSTVTVNSRRTWKPIFASPGTAYTDIAGSSASVSDITATSHEQLVQVETLAEVNPAIFTSVRNYVYDDIAILLPEDQRYDDSGE